MSLRKAKVKTAWNAGLAYCIGLLASDGNLSPDGRHINLTSKDLEVVDAFKKILDLSNQISKKARGGSKEKNYYVIQFGDVNF